MATVERRILAAWSGGLDSTGMVHRYLEAGCNVDVVYGHFKNNEHKSARELSARGIMLERFFKEHYHGKIRHLNTVEFSINSGCGNAAFTQIPPWLFTLISSVNPSHTEVALGYIMNDDAISYLDEIRTVWNAYQGLFEFELPPLVFPLMKIKKEQIYRDLPPWLRDRVTWCENVRKDDKCGYCLPCQRMISLGLQPHGESKSLLGGDDLVKAPPLEKALPVELPEELAVNRKPIANSAPMVVETGVKDT